MRRFILATNVQQLHIDGIKLIKMNIEDLKTIFNEDCLNVLTENEYNLLLQSEFLYGFEVELDSYLKKYRKVLNNIIKSDKDIICLFDATIKRYLNRHEVVYFANNKLYPSKLFNIEIEAQSNGTTYKTIGLNSIGLKEMSAYKQTYLNEEDFQSFKAIVTNFIVGQSCQIFINGNKQNFTLVEKEDMVSIVYNSPQKIFDFYIKDCEYINNIKYDLIAYHWPFFKKLHQQLPSLGAFVINRSKVNDIDNFDVHHVEEFAIVCDNINYNQENLFYARKFLSK